LKSTTACVRAIETKREREALLKVASEILGHASIQITADFSMHVLTDLHYAAVALLDDEING
jgi:hypothetical protein